MEKKIRLLFSAFCFIICCSTVKSQPIKTYTGSYEKGQATYQYYENKDYERFFQGSFSYTRKAYDYSYFEEVIKGNFKDNLKVGLWSSNKKRTISDSRIGELKVTETFSGKYSNGEKIGMWTYKKQTKLNDKLETENVICSFEANILVGEIKTNNLNGQFNRHGSFIGKWTKTISSFGEGKLEYIAEFKNNIFLKLTVRQVNDGKILLRYDNSEIVNKLNDSINKDICIIDKQRYKLKNIDSLNRYSNKENEYFFNFLEAIQKEVGEYDKPLRDVSLGSRNFQIKSPQVLIQKEMTYDEIVEEQKVKEREQARLEAEAKMIKKEQEQESIRQAKTKEEADYLEFINKLKTSTLSSSEIEFIGKWEFKSEKIVSEGNEVILYEEIFIVKADRSYSYTSYFRKGIKKLIYDEYYEKGYWELKNNAFYAYIQDENGKPSKRIDILKFNELSDNKASRTLKVFEDYPAVEIQGIKLNE